jgi:hypothetical protein
MLKLSKIIKIRGTSSGTDNSILAQIHQIIKFLVPNYQGVDTKCHNIRKTLMSCHILP